MKDAILVPQQALSRTPMGDARVMLVGAGDKVEARTVIANRTIGNSWLVSQGLQSGDRVIVEGLQKVRPGIAVRTTPAKLDVAILSGASAVASAPAAAH